jgi:hypothetical protein
MEQQLGQRRMRFCHDLDTHSKRYLVAKRVIRVVDKAPFSVLNDKE